MLIDPEALRSAARQLDTQADILRDDVSRLDAAIGRGVGSADPGGSFEAAYAAARDAALTLYDALGGTLARTSADLRRMADRVEHADQSAAADVTAAGTEL
ncbi:MAG TPA: hypothetical protein VLJ59_10600 [Mycobacteriales bacterium]|nr:hypothetical protein [Mycobacteriales bacterium]